MTKKKETLPTESLLEEADAIINGERRAEYGEAQRSFSRIARGWSEILDCKVTAKQVALAMVWLKISRELNKPKRDNMVDAAGYIGLTELLDE
jgi:hypothetical protein